MEKTRATATIPESRKRPGALSYSHISRSLLPNTLQVF